MGSIEEISSTQKDIRMLSKTEPPGRPAKPAPADILLDSKAALYMTSQFIHVNGGQVIGA